MRPRFWKIVEFVRQHCVLFSGIPAKLQTININLPQRHPQETLSILAKTKDYQSPLRVTSEQSWNRINRFGRILLPNFFTMKNVTQTIEFHDLH